MTDFDLPSTLPKVKASILALHKAPAATPLLKGVTVDYGDPGVDKLMREHLFLSGTADTDTEWAPFGRLAQEEIYGIDHFVHVANLGWTQQQATERAYALAAVTNHLLRPLIRTPTQLAPGVYGVRFRPRQLTEFISNEGYAALLHSVIAIKARI